MNFEKLTAEFVVKTQNQNRITLKTIFGDEVYEQANNIIFKETDELAMKILKQIDKCNVPADFSEFKSIGIAFSDVELTSSKSDATIIDAANDEKPRQASRSPLGNSNLCQKLGSALTLTQEDMFSPITDEEFKKIPKYMRGSITLTDLNIMLKKLEEVMRNNWTLRHKPLAKLSPKQKDTVVLMRDELDALQLHKDSYFCQENQWTVALDTRLRSKVRLARPCYRHLNRTKESNSKANYLNEMISVIEFSKWTGITPFEILIHAIALLVSTLLLVLKVYSVVVISYWQIFYPLFFACALNGYFLFIIFVRSVLEERQSKHAILNNAFNFLRVSMITLFEVLLCHKIGGDFEQAEVAVQSTYGLVFMPLWILMTSLGFQACRLL